MMLSTPLERLARLCSILGGLVMTGLMLMTCYSLIGRNFFDSALIGDFELTGVGAGAAIALFMPWCQFKRENIMVCSAGRKSEKSVRVLTAIQASSQAP